MHHLKSFRVFFLMLLLLFGSNVLNAQDHRCGTTQYQQQLISKNPAMLERMRLNEDKIQRFLQQPQYNKTNSIVIVPVVIHLLYNTSSPEQNLSEAQIISQIAVLNEDYSRKNADTIQTPDVWKNTGSATDFQFALAKRDPKGLPTNGIVRKITTNTSFPFGLDQERYSSSGGDDGWSSDQYLNIWVVPSITGGGGGEVLGFCSQLGTDQFIDGITVGYKYFGRNSRSSFYNLGRTVTHEVGHWFGLYHLWGTNDGACATGDSINDTPLQSMSSSGRPTFPKTDVCAPNPPGVMFMNFMDYADDAAMNIFTIDQVARMYAVLNTYRPMIKSSNGAVAGLQSALFHSDVAIYPNPTNGTMTIRADFSGPVKISLSIYSVLGQIIRKEKLATGLTEIDLTQESDGYYLLKFETGDQSLYRKIIVSKE